jgi:hypothetical protein
MVHSNVGLFLFFIIGWVDFNEFLDHIGIKTKKLKF